MRNFYKAVSLFLVIILSVTSCSFFIKDDDLIITSNTSEDKGGYPVFFGNYEIESEPSTIASLSPAITEILFELGFGDRIILKSDFCDFPEAAESIKSVGSPINPDFDLIIEQKPDVLLSFASISEKDLNILYKNGIVPVILNAPQDMESLKSIYTILGVILCGNNEKALESTDFFEKSFEQLYTDEVKIGKFAYITTSYRLAGKSTIEDDFLSNIGENIIQSEGYTDDLTALADKQVDILLVSNEYTIDDIKKIPELSKLECVEKNRVIFLDNQRFERPTSRLMQILEKLKY
ncbi:MAG: ABC transporter substrate-binding protein [Clostridiales bacterium]|nr:ABC transporter substrate-binding protein [Clostridiales bacterium]